MSVAVRCEPPFRKADLKRMIESCGGSLPMEPRCPPISKSCGPGPICCYTGPPPSPPPPCNSNCPEPMPVTCMPCPQNPPLLPCPPRPFVCPPCTGHPCITCAPLPKPVPAPFEFGPIIRAPITTGGLFYIGSIKYCYPCYPCMPSC